MIAELGHLSIAIALAFSALLAGYALIGAQRGHGGMMSLSRPLAIGQFVFTAIAFTLLVTAFVQNDFSIAYVAANSNTQLPWFLSHHRSGAPHEGSFLLWMLMQAGWIAAVALFSRSMPLPMVARVLGILVLSALVFICLC